MRETRIAQRSIFDNYSKHDIGSQLQQLSAVLDDHPEILSHIKKDLVDESLKPVGRTGLTVDSVFRCLLLKQQLGVSYEQLAFHLSSSAERLTTILQPSPAEGLFRPVSRQS